MIGNGQIDIATYLSGADFKRRLVAQRNYVRVYDYMRTHLGCSPKEVAHALDLSWDQARRAFRRVRNEWNATC